MFKTLKVTDSHWEQLNGWVFYRNICSRDGRWRGPRYSYSNYEVAIHTVLCLHKTPLWLIDVHHHDGNGARQLCLICFSFSVSVRLVGWYEEESDCNNYTAGWYHQSQYAPTVTIPPSPSHNTGEHRESRQYQHIWYFSDGWRDQFKLFDTQIWQRRLEFPMNIKPNLILMFQLYF